MDEIEKKFGKNPREKIFNKKELKDERVHLVLYFFDGRTQNSNDFNIIKML